MWLISELGVVKALEVIRAMTAIIPSFIMKEPFEKCVTKFEVGNRHRKHRRITVQCWIAEPIYRLAMLLS